MRTLSFVEAMNEALREEMRRDPSVYVMGLGLNLSTKGPSITGGLLEEFGERRVRSRPISAAPVAGACRSPAQLARAPLARFLRAPGLKIEPPPTPYDAKGLLKTASRDDNPVVFFQH